MKKTLFALAALAALVSCKSLKNEWDPVFDNGKNKPAKETFYTDIDMTNMGMRRVSIADLKALYQGKPTLVSGNVWIKGQVTTSDQSGNIYNEIYLQDDSGAIDLKLGRSSLYNEYKLGQWVYVKCDGLTLGSYNGMPQLGFAADETTTNEYDTSYIQLQALIDEHVFKGEQDTPVKPAVVSEDEIKKALSKGTQDPLWGMLITVQGLTYGNQIFALFYPNPNMAHKSGNPENRVFLSDAGTWGVDTWACTKAGFIGYLNEGVWDAAQVGSGATRYGTIMGTPNQYLSDDVAKKFGSDAFLTYKEIMIKYATANYISHYFKLGSTDVQVRTSGYAKFADKVIDEDILAGAPVDITGIITLYSGAAQFTLVDDPSISVVIE
jgi:hypothetical protein